MSNLTNEQLDLLTNKANARLAEFGTLLALPKLAPGVVRIVHDVIDEWWNDLDVEPPAPKTDTVDNAVAARLADGILQDAYHAGYSRGKAAAKPANWATAVAHCKRLNMNWEQLAAEAGLKPNPRGVRVGQ